MTLSETNEVRSFNYSKCNNLQASMDIFTDELPKLIDDYNKVTQEKKDWQILLEASLIEVDILGEELEKVKVQLNITRKSPSHCCVGYN